MVWLDTTGWLQSSVVRRRWRSSRRRMRKRRRKTIHSQYYTKTKENS